MRQREKMDKNAMLALLEKTGNTHRWYAGFLPVHEQKQNEFCSEQIISYMEQNGN